MYVLVSPFTDLNFNFIFLIRIKTHILLTANTKLFYLPIRSSTYQENYWNVAEGGFGLSARQESKLLLWEGWSLLLHF